MFISVSCEFQNIVKDKIEDEVYDIVRISTARNMIDRHNMGKCIKQCENERETKKSER